ncbi:MAG: AcrR family transcriptional regulator [Hyphomicrobiaceae bacterium]
MSSLADPSRRERRKLEVRARIVAAATELFAEHGFNETKVAWVCERADIAHKTFFNHFPTKQDVMHAIAADGIESLLSSIDAAREAGTDTRDRLTQFFDSVASRATDAGPMHRELLTEIINAAQQVEGEANQARRLHDAFNRLVKQGVREGDVTRQHSTETLTEMLLGTYYALMFNWASLENYKITTRAHAAARFLGDALARRTDEPTS